jgi:amino acid adenylation domain-containing protein
MIGCMVNNVVFRTPIDGNPAFRDLLRSERTTAISAYEHSALPFEKVVEAVDPTRALGCHPLFQVLFLFDDQRQGTAHAQHLEFAVEALPVDRSSYWDLGLSFSDHGPGEPLTGFVGYRTDLFDAWFMDALPSRLQMLLQSIVENPDQTLSRLAMIDSVALQQLLGKWNHSPAASHEPSSLHECFERQAALTPESIAVHACEGEQLSYRHLNQAANQLAWLMAERGAGPGEIIGVYLDRSVEGIRALLAILKTGAAVLPLDPSYPPARVAHMLAEAKPCMIVTNLALSAQLSAENIPLVCVDGHDRTLIKSAGSGNLDRIVLPRDPAYVLFTSGSTGKPKGCIGLHEGSVNRVHWMWNAFDFGSSDRFAQRTSLNFVDSLWEIFGALGNGIPLVLVPEGLEKDTGEFVAFLAEQAVTHLVVVPSLLTAILETGRNLDRDLPALRSLVTSGEPLSGTLLQKFRAAFPGRRILNTYGTTEFWDATCFDATDFTATEGIVPIGRPLPNVRCYILDASEELVPPGVWGELHVGSSGFAAEYLNRPDLSKEKYVVDRFSANPADRLYRTGDLTRFLPDGTIEFRGRADRQLKVRGFRVEPAEIEALLDQHPGIEASAVVGQQAASGAVQLVAYLVPCTADSVTDPEVMCRYLKEFVPEYMLPDAFVNLEGLPQTPSGKIDRLALPAPGREDRTSRPYVAPRSATESELAAIWADVLDCPKLGVHDDFFRLGGHSLLAVRLMARVSEVLRVDLPLQCLFEAPTVAELGNSVDAIQWTMDQGDDLPGDDREVIRI